MCLQILLRLLFFYNVSALDTASTTLPVSITHSFGCLPFSLHQSCFYQGHQPLFHIQQSILSLIIQQHLTSFAPGSQPTTLTWFSFFFHQLFFPFPTSCLWCLRAQSSTTTFSSQSISTTQVLFAHS